MNQITRGVMRSSFSIKNNIYQILYWYFSLFLIYLFSCYFPFAMEYYVAKPEESMFSYMLNRFITAREYSYYEMIMLFLLVVLFFLLTLRVEVSLFIVSILGVILSYASQLKYVNRLELLNYTDLKLTEAADMALNYLSIKMDKYLVFPVIFLLLILISAFLLTFLLRKTAIKEKVKRNKSAVIIRIVAFFLCCIAVCGFHESFMQSESSKNLQSRYMYFLKNSDRHVIFQFLQSKQTSSSPDEILHNYVTLTDTLINNDTEVSNSSSISQNFTELPTIIVIMNESWWNLDFIPSEYVTYSTSPMEPLWDLEDRCDIGTTSVNIYGGGTISSEAEFLTGFNTKYFTTTSDIYNIMDGKNVPTIVDYFKELGYKTTAIHPYYSTFYNRENIYSQIGFEHYIFEDSMSYKTLFDKFISDSSLVDQIIYEYEQNSDDANFIFGISIASHGMNLDYLEQTSEKYDYSIDVKLNDNVVMNEEDYSSFVHYVNGIYEANLAYTKLINYFENQDKPVMIVMFGDHCPNFTTTMLETLGMNVSYDEKWIYSASDTNVMKNIHTTPVVAWNNFSEANFEMNGENINALGDKIIDYTALPDTRMTLINKYLRNFLKADTRSHMLDSYGNMVSELTDEQIAAIETVLMIQYDMLYGEQVCENLWEPIK